MTLNPRMGTYKGFKVKHKYILGNYLKTLLSKNFSAPICEITVQASKVSADTEDPQLAGNQEWVQSLT